MARASEIGATRVFTKDDGAAFDFHPSCYDSIIEAWMAGKAFFSGLDLYSMPMTIKLGTVSVICKCTPTSIAACIQEQAEDENERRIKGDD